jgi:hypothetical protein
VELTVTIKTQIIAYLSIHRLENDTDSFLNFKYPKNEQHVGMYILEAAKSKSLRLTFTYELSIVYSMSSRK